MANMGKLEMVEIIFVGTGKLISNVFVDLEMCGEHPALPGYFVIH